MHVVLHLSFTASTFVIAFAQFGIRGSDRRSARDLVETLDQLVKKNQQLVKRNQQLMGKIASLQNAPMAAYTPVNQVQTIDHMTARNQQLLGKNKQLLAETAAVRSNLVGSETHAEGKGTLKKIMVWFFSIVGGGLG